MEMVVMLDLKSSEHCARVGSTPTSDTKYRLIVYANYNDLWCNGSTSGFGPDS